MSWKWPGVWTLFAFLPYSYGITHCDSTEYVAAVVEYSPIYVKDDGPLTLKKNAEEYVGYIKKASEQNADIIVFPENGLSTVYLPPKSGMDLWATLIPSASENYNPCTQDTINVSETLKMLSCAAKQNRIYVVVNIGEKFISCEKANCSTHYYNSNAVFDRTGKIIARYRKTTLYEEPQFEAPKNQKIVTFETDFGVKFGTFICFDILFREPALNLTRELGVTDIVYPTAWFSETPFLTATQAQYAWAFSQNVNLLASGYRRPEFGNTGSGIFLGRKGIAKAVFDRHLINTNSTRLLISRVPKIKGIDTCSASDSISNKQVPQVPEDNAEEPLDDEVALMHESLTNFKTRSLLDSEVMRICDGDFCCKFTSRFTNTDPTTEYRAAVFDGVRMYGSKVKAGVRLCAVVQCFNNTIESCGWVQNSATTFEILQIEAQSLYTYPRSSIAPTVLSSDLLPFENWTYTETNERDGHVDVSMSVNGPMTNLATFGIYSRIFSRDVIPNVY